MTTKRDVRRLLLAKIESVYGTDPTPTGAANAILCHWRDLPQPAQSDYVDRALLYPYFGRSQQFPSNAKISMGFDCELAGGGAAGTAPAWGPLARMCGFAETISAGVSVVYNPISSAEESATLWYNIDDLRQKAKGSRGSLGLSIKAGAVPLINFTTMGLYDPPADAAPATPTYTGFITPLIVNKVNTPTFTLLGYAAVMRELTIDMKKPLIYRDWVNTKKVDVGGQVPDGSVTIELPSIADKDYFAAHIAGTLGALQLIHGTVAGNIVQIDCPKVQVTNPRYASEQGIALLTLDLALVPSSGNDELTITLT